MEYRSRSEQVEFTLHQRVTVDWGDRAGHAARVTNIRTELRRSERLVQLSIEVEYESDGVRLWQPPHLLEPLDEDAQAAGIEHAAEVIILEESLTGRWRELPLKCCYSLEPLIDPARASLACNHPPRCNHDSLQLCLHATRCCPVEGCNVKDLRSRDIVRDDELRVALARLPRTDAEVCWLRGASELRLEPPPEVQSASGRGSGGVSGAASSSSSRRKSRASGRPSLRVDGNHSTPRHSAPRLPAHRPPWSSEGGTQCIRHPDCVRGDHRRGICRLRPKLEEQVQNAATAGEDEDEEDEDEEGEEDEVLEVPSLSVGTVLWAKVPGHPWWPAIVAHQHGHAPEAAQMGWTFVRFFRSDNYGYCQTVEWAALEASATARAQQGARVKGGKKKLTEFQLAVDEAREELACPSLGPAERTAAAAAEAASAVQASVSAASAASAAAQASASAAASAAGPVAAEKSMAVEADEEGRQQAGYRLHLSSRSSSGYKGVQPTPGGKFVAMHKSEYIGIFKTAVEAATAYAKHLRSLENTDEEEGGTSEAAGKEAEVVEPDAHGGDSAPCMVQLSAREVAVAAREAAVLVKAAEQEAREKAQEDREAKLDAREAALDRREVALDQREAALRSEIEDEEDDKEEVIDEMATGRISPHLTLRSQPVAATAVEPVTEAEGYQLFLSTKSSTGYKGVTWVRRRGNFQARGVKARAPSSRGHARGAGGRNNKHLGYFATATEAAVAYAKYMEEICGDDEAVEAAAGGASDDGESDVESDGESDEGRNVCDDEGRKLCNEFGCTRLDNHSGLHLLPTEEPGASSSGLISSRVRKRPFPPSWYTSESIIC